MRNALNLILFYKLSTLVSIPYYPLDTITSTSACILLAMFKISLTTEYAADSCCLARCTEGCSLSALFKHKHVVQSLWVL